MLLIAVVDDDPKDAELLKECVENYCKLNDHAAMIHVFSDGLDLIRSTENHDIIFLDIQMGKLDGLETARFIRKINKENILIFVTNMAQFAIKGYEVDAIDFILKPLVPNIFMAKMKKFAAAVMSNQSSEITLLINNGKRVIRSSDIVYVEVIKHDLSFHTVNGVFTERCSLKEVDSRLSKSHFSRPNYCYLVNLRYVVAIEKFDVILSTGDALQISRNRKKEFVDDFSRFLGGSF